MRLARVEWVELAVGAAVALCGAWALFVAYDQSCVEGGRQDVAMEVVVPVAVVLGLGMTAWNLPAGSRWWLVPLAFFAVAMAFPLVAWSDSAGGDDGGANDGFLPESLGEFLLILLSYVGPLAVLAGVVAGAIFLVRRRWRLGAWCLLAASTLASGFWVMATFCV